MRFSIKNRLATAFATLCWFVAALLMFNSIAPRCDGQTLATRWTSFLNGPANMMDEGFAVQVGPDGNVVTTSNSAFLRIGSTTGSYSDIWTVKYDGSTGAQIWQRRSHATNDRSDKVSGMAMDADGNVIVAGLRDGLNPNHQSFYAAKYAALDGAVLWERVFNDACYFTGVAVDSKGDVIATGVARLNTSSPIESDIYTFKFAGATGQTLWENHYSAVDSTSTTTDGAKAIALDADGNAFVTGYASFGQYVETVTLKIDGSEGSTLWAKQRRDSGTSGSSGQDIAIDASGDALIATSTTQGFSGMRVVKYQGADGTELWANVQDGPQRDEPSSLTVDAQGNVAVTGYTYVALATKDDIFTRKMNGVTGQTLWTKTYDGGAGRDDRGISVRFDATGNTVVAGFSGNASGNGPDTMILRYAPDGTVLTQQRIAVSGGEDYPGSKDALFVGPGHVTVVGGSYSRPDIDAFTLRLNDPANPSVATRAPGQIGATTAQVGARVNPNGSATNLRYVYGTSATALNQATADKSMGNGFAAVESVDTLAGLQPSTTYFYQARAIGNGQTAQGETLQFTTLSNDATLASLGVSSGALNPSFSPTTLGYFITLPPTATVIAVTPTTANPAATLTVNEIPSASGEASAPIPLPFGNTAIETRVTAEDGTTTRIYSVNVTRVPEKFIFSSATDVPVRAPGFSANGLTADLVLDFSPPTGSNLTMVDNTGLAFINGHFTNLADGQEIILHYGGASYPYVVNYHGGDGNDLVLTWAHQRVYAWGYNNAGQLGLGTTTDATVPTALPATSPLAGKTVFSLAAGYGHSLALCSDGSLFAWGLNGKGQLGNGTSANSTVPVNITGSGVLAGKQVISIAAGVEQSFAICSDGTLAAWGGNTWGILGDGTSINRSAPVAVVATGFLAGKQVVSVSSGQYLTYALCSDGTIAGWGNNVRGQLGSTAPSNTMVPVEVTRNGALLGKQVTSATAGADTFGMFRCSDGTAAGLGWNNAGQLGNGNTSDANVPVRVVTSGVLSGKSLLMVSPGNHHCVALTTDGTAVSWGENILGTLGNNSTSNSSSPVAVQAGGVLAGKTITRVNGNYFNSAAICADGTIAIWGYGGSGALGNGSTAASKVPVAANPPATGEKFTSLSEGSSAAHFLAIAAVPLSNDSSLASLTLSAGSIEPAFSPGITQYAATVPSGLVALTVTPTPSNRYATVAVNGGPLSNDSAGAPIAIFPGDNLVSIVVTAETGATTTYTVTVNRPPLVVSFGSAGTIGTSAAEFSARGNTVDISLDFAPAPGTVLTVIDVTDPAFIDGEFVNLAQGQHVVLTHGGVGYDFVANYFGGTGNDLVLQWAATQVHAWGANNYGQLGDDTNKLRLAPVATDDSGTLANKTIVSLAGGYLNSLALCSDGTLASWGYNVYGQLGNGGSAASSVPVEVDGSGALAGRKVIAISAGSFHNLALCSDGSVAAWGYNNYGQLGAGDRTTRRTPVLVNPVGALAGKQVVGIAAGAYQSFALCADGSVVAWGYNDEGELGDNSNVSRLVPVAVDASAVLANKKVASISAGQYHTLALCTDGTLVSWGYNPHGELGNNSTNSSKVPVAIGSFGILAGKTVSAIAAGGSHSLALCSDGTLAAWGNNNQFQLGTTSIGQSLIPSIVIPTGAISGKTISRIAAGAANSMVGCSDGTLAAWGDNSSGQLGNNSTITSEVPSSVDSSSLAAGSRFMSAATGSGSLHSLAIVGIPAPISDVREIQEPSGVQLLPLGDEDHDGIPNLVERAFGLDPTQDSSGKLPTLQQTGDNHVIEFDEPDDAEGITYGVEVSSTMKSGSWSELADSGEGRHHIFIFPANDGQTMFFRLKVSE